MSRIRKSPPGVDPELLVKDAAKLMPNPTRRLFLRGGASLGALAFLTGCDIVHGASAEQVLMKISYFNDGAQAWLFNPNKLAATYPDSGVTRPFPFNAYYPEEDAPEVDKEDYKLEVGGMIDNTKSWTLDELYALPQETQITRLVCVEGWSAIGKWTGTPLREFSALTRARGTCGSAAPRAIPPRSTCRLRCIRRRR
jgi:DMSO/TMAO reductase YedYZ molybdopterin-dependent catalytic subunit